MMKKTLLLWIHLLYPFLFLAAFIYLGEQTYTTSEGYYSYYADIKIVNYSFFFICYGFPFCAFYYFIKNRPFSQWLLPVGFLLVPVLPFAFYAIFPTSFYLGMLSAVVLIFYAAPFTIISLILAFVITHKDKIAQSKTEV